ncbi:MAG: hypothetical protein IPM95_03155 [Sphingobacteriales bacterium]|nr:hypothetical protein [Sphingobacteriales bacterium]
MVAQNPADRVRLKSEDGIDVFYACDAQGRLAQQRSSMYSFYDSYVYRNDSILIYAVDHPYSTLEKYINSLCQCLILLYKNRHCCIVWMFYFWK